MRDEGWGKANFWVWSVQKGHFGLLLSHCTGEKAQQRKHWSPIPSNGLMDSWKVSLLNTIKICPHLTNERGHGFLGSGVSEW